MFKKVSALFGGLVLGSSLFAASAFASDTLPQDVMTAPNDSQYGNIILNLEDTESKMMQAATSVIQTGNAAASRALLVKEDDDLGTLLTIVSRIIPPDGWEKEQSDVLLQTQYLRLAVESTIHYIDTGNQEYLDWCKYDLSMASKYTNSLSNDVPKSQ
jgi:acyl-CoA thioesterase